MQSDVKRLHTKRNDCLLLSAFIDYQTTRSLTWLTPSAILPFFRLLFYSLYYALLSFHENTHTQTRKKKEKKDQSPWKQRHSRSIRRVVCCFVHDGMASIWALPFSPVLFLLFLFFSSSSFDSSWPYHACGRRRCVVYPVRSLLIYIWS